MGKNRGHKTPHGFRKTYGPKRRIVYDPNKHVRKIHAEFLNSIGKVSLPSSLDCVKKHIHQRFLLKVDIEEAFNSVKEIDVLLVLDFDFDDNGRYFFHQNGGLIQGAPSSTTLFHLFCAETIDKKLKPYCRRHNLTFTRYIDDIVISSPNRWFTRVERTRIYKKIRNEGFELNPDKVCSRDIRLVPMEVLGTVMFDRFVFPKKKIERKLEKSVEGTPSHQGLLAWKDSILALNDHSHYNETRYFRALRESMALQ